MMTDAGTMDPSDTYRDEDWLRSQHNENERSVQEIADDVGVNPSTIYNWLKKHGIATVKQGGPVYEADTKMLRDEPWLRKQYVDKERSIADIAGEVGVSQPTVSQWLDSHGIESPALEEHERD
ncbi:hypothetical protein [environmental halophage 1 AAJ-2005]|nr:hypothetical protein [environmental halophage 1 AAJ-2005]